MRSLTKQSPFRVAAIATIVLLIACANLLAKDPGYLPPNVAMAEMLKVREKEGDQAAITFLEEQLREASKIAQADQEFLQSSRPDDFYYYYFYYIWKEAQVHSGRTDRLWASQLNDVVFTVSLEERRYREAFAIFSNLCSSLAASGRYGRLAEVLATWEEAQRQGGNPMDISACPDLGEAIPCLSEIRHRELEATVPFLNAIPEGLSPRSRPQSFRANEAGAFLSYAACKYNAGDWQEGLEWMVWVRDWATDKKTGQPSKVYPSKWYKATESLISAISDIGYVEEALAMTEKALAAPHGDTYDYRHQITLEISKLDLLRQLDRTPSDFIEQLRDLVVRCENNKYLSENSIWSVKASLAKGLIHTGQIQEGEELLNALIKEGAIQARWAILEHWLETGQFQHFESEIVTLLEKDRDLGCKICECKIYSMYARFLEATGRYQEALQMYREAIRLARAFDLYYRLPVDLARLASLLNRLGNAQGAAKLADEARSRIATGRIAPSNVQTAEELLVELAAKVTELVEEKTPQIDLQPESATVVPIAEQTWTSYLTLTNPTNKLKNGRLSAKGRHIALAEIADSEDISATLCNPEDATGGGLELTIAPGSYRLIHILGNADSEAQTTNLEFNWTDPSITKPKTANILVEPSLEGVTSGIIQAGAYRENPFYSVPIHHHYVDASGGESSLPLRFICSRRSRIELYLIDGTPLAIDSHGNGSLLDSGDQLFTESDGKGHLRLPLTDGAAGLQLLVYPEGPLPKEGLRIDIQLFENGAWQDLAQNQINP